LYEVCGEHLLPLFNTNFIADKHLHESSVDEYLDKTCEWSSSIAEFAREAAAGNICRAATICSLADASCEFVPRTQLFELIPVR
jgi:hypothetical protein